MSWLKLFSRKASPAPDSELARNPSSVMKTQLGEDSQSARLRDDRIDRRERLYGVVRTSLTDAGVLTPHFKFKVLALDDRGQQFLVMVDLAPQWGAQPEWRASLESKIIQAARVQHGLVITSVYWRGNSELASALTSAPVPAAVNSRPASDQESHNVPPSQAGGLGGSSRYEPIQADEVAAFQKALEEAARAPSVSGKIH